MQLGRNKTNTTYTFTANENGRLDFAPKSPLCTVIKQVLLNGKPVAFEVKSNAEGVSMRLNTSFAKGKTVVSLVN